jgi:hypothetical protein
MSQTAGEEGRGDALIKGMLKRFPREILGNPQFQKKEPM